MSGDEDRSSDPVRNDVADRDGSRRPERVAETSRL